jgi:hypothetical protein
VQDGRRHAFAGKPIERPEQYAVELALMGALGAPMLGTTTSSASMSTMRAAGRAPGTRASCFACLRSSTRGGHNDPIRAGSPSEVCFDQEFRATPEVHAVDLKIFELCLLKRNRRGVGGKGRAGSQISRSPDAHSDDVARRPDPRRSRHDLDLDLLRQSLSKASGLADYLASG